MYNWFHVMDNYGEERDMYVSESTLKELLGNMLKWYRECTQIEIDKCKQNGTH